MLTEALKSNKRVQDNLEKEKQLANNRYHANTKLMEEMGELKKEKSKVETEHKGLQSLLEKKKAAEMELETMVKDLKDKLGKFDGDKKSAMKMEKGLLSLIFFSLLFVSAVPPSSGRILISSFPPSNFLVSSLGPLKGFF